MDTEEVQLFIRTMILKNQLLNAEDIAAVYEDKEGFLFLMRALVELINSENAFFLLDSSISDKIYKMITFYRSQEEYKEYSTAFNGIIGALNGLNGYDQEMKCFYLKNYLEYQQMIRGVRFRTYEDVRMALSYDGYIYMKLMGDKDLNDVDDSSFFGTINYFLEYMPQFFQESDIYSVTLTKLEAISDNIPLTHFLQKRNVKKSIGKLEKLENQIYKKEK